MEEIYIEEFASTGLKKKFNTPPTNANDVAPKSEVEVLEAKTPYGHLINLEKAVRSDCNRTDLLLLYVKDIKKELDKGDSQTALHLIDELERLIDVDLFEG